MNDVGGPGRGNKTVANLATVLPTEPAKRFSLHSAEISGQPERNVQRAVARIKALGEDPEADADLAPAPDDKPEVRREKAIQRHEREMRRGVAVHEAITAGNKVRGVELDAIAKLPIQERKEAIAQAKAGKPVPRPRKTPPDAEAEAALAAEFAAMIPAEDRSAVATFIETIPAKALIRALRGKD